MITERPPSPVDMDRFRFRTFVESLGSDALERHAEPVTLAQVAQILEGNPRAVLFDNLGPEGASLAGNVLGSRERMARAFGVSPGTAAGRSAQALAQAAAARRDALGSSAPFTK